MHLRDIPLFAAISDTSLAKLEKKAARLVFTRGQDIISRADPSRDAYVLLSGEARVTFFSASGKAVAFRQIEPGDLFGEFAAIDGKGRSATVEAMQKVEVLCIGEQLFWELMHSDPPFTAAVMRHLVDLLRTLTARIVEYSTMDVRGRIHAELLRMAQEALLAGGKAEIYPAPTHSDLAARISTHREAVSRELSLLARRGIVEKSGRALFVLDVDRLEQLVHAARGD